eukprot:TRINITY_DN201_c0_g1_i2.p1 TRINITY_DN201_c0_g1~~TRINITY_DN201_c0_g1_i2.p1  ORF type:complete len:194 (-),score=50.40 TRINITY_DN201_c0_g1_i2:48-629(-)
MQSLKCVVVGDGFVGKTWLLQTFTTNESPNEQSPFFMNRSADGMVNGKPITVEFVDTYGEEEYDGVRHLCYAETDVFLVCFSIDFPPSLQNVRSMWYAEIQRHCPGTPILLVGTKLDLRGDPETISKLESNGLKMIGKEEALAVAKEIGAEEYHECSAVTQEQLKTVFDRAVHVGLNNKKISSGRSNGKCTIL